MIMPVNIYVAEEQEKNNNRSEEVKASDIAVMTVDLTEGLRKLGGAVQSEGVNMLERVIFHMQLHTVRQIQDLHRRQKQMTE